MTDKNYVVGIDVGESGIGKVAIELSDQGMPIMILSSVVTIIDGGKSPDSGQSPRSRKKMGGMARRARRLVRRRANRIKALGRLLDELGIVDKKGIYDNGVTYEPWKVRVALYSGYETDTDRRNADLRLAIMHIARHRGWRNPWWRFERLSLETTDAPSEMFERVQERAASILGTSIDKIPTVGHIGALADNPGHKLRPRNLALDTSKLKDREASEKIIIEKLHQVDLLRELRQILKTQKIDSETAKRISEQVFSSRHPFVPSENVGLDSFNKLPRAPKSSAEFQEFRIRDSIANLRFKTTNQPLSAEQKDTIVDRLMTWAEEKDNPSWADVASWLGLGDQDLKFATSDSPALSKAPINTPHNRIACEENLSSDKVRAGLREKYLALTPDVQKELCAFIGDATDSEDSEILSEFFDGLTEEEMAKLESFDGLSGRAAYSRETLTKLNKAMATGLDLNKALVQEYGVVSGWKPPAESIFAHIDHPVVDRVLTDVGRWLDWATTKYGPPISVNVEHVRSAFFGPEAKADYISEINRNKNARQKAVADIVQQENIDAKQADPRRALAIRIQNGQCLYCGTTITYKSCEMDHIVPRAVGGSNRRENLVAVCQECNRSKGSQPFATWAASSYRASLDEAIVRVTKHWSNSKDLHMSSKAWGKFKNQVVFRLRRTELDDELDERALASTAYSAVEVRERIQGFLAEKFVDPSSGELANIPVNVFSGSLTSAGRKAAGIERRIRLHGFDVENPAPGKSRFDRRHHAVDAATIAMMNSTAAKTLSQREEWRRFASSDPSAEANNWKQFEGSAPDHFRAWIANVQKMADLFNETIEKDRVVVMRPLRLGANVGKLHKDGIDPLTRISKEVALQGLDSEQVRRIVDKELWLQLQPLLDKKGNLPASEDGSVLPDEISLFPSPNAMLAVREGATGIGDTLHHARVYAINNGNGKPISYKILRVFAGEFGRIGWKNKPVDLFWNELPYWSESMRCADPGLVEHIRNGSAKQIGWLVRGDELELPVNSDYVPVIEPIAGVLGNTIREYTWVVTGFMDNARVSIAPALLAREGISDPQSLPAVMAGNNWTATANILLKENPTIIRRSASGIPRWRDNGDGLPVSWSVAEATKKTLEG